MLKDFAKNFELFFFMLLFFLFLSGPAGACCRGNYYHIFEFTLSLFMELLRHYSLPAGEHYFLYMSHT